jgi:hypothetical protein
MMVMLVESALTADFDNPTYTMEIARLLYS